MDQGCRISTPSGTRASPAGMDMETPRRGCGGGFSRKRTTNPTPRAGTPAGSRPLPRHFGWGAVRPGTRHNNNPRKEQPRGNSREVVIEPQRGTAENPSKQPPGGGCFDGFNINVWQRPALPHPLECSTIGAGSRNDRVRNGTGCDTSALTTKQTNEHPHTAPQQHEQQRGGQPSNHTTPPTPPLLLLWVAPGGVVSIQGVLPQNRIVCVNTRTYQQTNKVKSSAISTRPLHVLQRFHARPINPVISRAPHQHHC